MKFIGQSLTGGATKDVEMSVEGDHCVTVAFLRGWGCPTQNVLRGNPRPPVTTESKMNLKFSQETQVSFVALHLDQPNSATHAIE